MKLKSLDVHCNHQRKYMRISLHLKPINGLPVGFCITHYCDYCGGRGEGFVVQADSKEIMAMIGRSLDNANEKIWPVD